MFSSTLKRYWFLNQCKYFLYTYLISFLSPLNLIYKIGFLGKNSKVFGMCETVFLRECEFLLTDRSEKKTEKSARSAEIGWC